MLKQFVNYCLLMLLSSPVFCQTGFGTAAPNSTLDVRGAVAIGLRTFTTSTTLSFTDHTIVFTGTADATATLPDATSCKGRIYWIKNASGTLPVPAVHLVTTAAQTIGSAAGYDVDELNEAVRLISNGQNWEIASQGIPTAKTLTTGGAWKQGGNTLKLIKTIGTISNTDFPFNTGNTEMMRLSSAGFLGIGTTNPQSRLHVLNDNNDDGNNYVFSDYFNGAATTAGFFMKKSSGTFSSPGNLQNGDTIGQFRFSPRYSGSVLNSRGSGLDAVYKGDGITSLTDFRFFTSSAERMRINENGKICIGTTVPDGLNPEKLLVDAGNTGSYNVISGKGDINNYLQLNVHNNSSGLAASSDLVATANNGTESDNYIDLGINSSAYNTATLPILNAINQAYLYSTGADFVIGNGTALQDLVLFTNGYALANERMRITSAGNIGIGQISTLNEKLIVGGIVTPGSDNAYTLGTSTARWSQVWATNGVIQTSDLRLKTNIQPLTYGIKNLMQMHPVGYNWKTDPDHHRKIGLIAQEIQQVIPEVVKGDASRENLGMNYAELVAVLIHSLQEQQLKIKDLNEQLNILMLH